MDRFSNTGMPDGAWWAALWPDPAGTLRRLGVEPGTTLADVGCGRGHFTLPAARLVGDGPVYAVDVDADLVERTAERAADAGLDAVEPVHGDARELRALLPERVDYVLFANAFHGVDERASFVREVRNALRPGGTFGVVNWHDRPPEETPVLGEPRGPPAEPRLSPGAARDPLEPVFETVRLVALPPHHYGLVCRRTG